MSRNDKFSLLAKAYDRTRVSDRSAAVLVLHDLGVESPIDRSKVIDWSKVRRKHNKTPEKLQQNDDQFDHTGIEGVFLWWLQRSNFDTISRRRQQVPQSEWVSSFLTAHQHNIGYLVPYNGEKVSEWVVS